MSVTTRPGSPRRGRGRGRAGSSLRVVALGGGHGLASNLRSLRLLVEDITAVVTVADNGGSSGRIRGELPVLPPGDLRMALAALCEQTEWGTIWHDVIQHRFATDGELSGHALGNLLIVAMWQIMDDPIAGLDQVGELLGARGRVLPMALEPLDIEATVRFEDGSSRLVRGQAQVATAPGRVEEMRLIPEDPAVPAEVLEAIARADWVILGPGSWYTSVLPHLRVPQIAEALRTTSARCAVIMNLSSGAHEIAGMGSRDLLQAVIDQAPGVRIDALIADPTALPDALDLAEFAEGLGIQALLRQVSVGDGTPTHDPVRLAAAYRDVFEGAYGDVDDDRRRSGDAPRSDERN
ncbi:uridine diphosphate-N-acetylglucosamine-binding protein YvcK [Brachybacterium sp. JHP9]|uniref:Putative gluconeogenesis factor n=1 Tax=Brachybacterium equifaecis TaxID=2910770 RepID=A0ABT0R2B5_9MICO|nr:uridine diphosphate-N-acetylglucosamine-binding protein YvcK [Brachybacterium equifaecis]MCL6423379.1 uridine diphosphate-N-acetylglucosamine-binding protein YvcK [Brachybacterium equifaecis]